MICPRCGNEWNATKSPCTRCGLVIRIPNAGPLGPTYAPPTSPQKTHTISQQPGGMSPVKLQSGSSSINNPKASTPPPSSRAVANGNGPAFPHTPPPHVPNTPHTLRFFHTPSPTPAPGLGNNPAQSSRLVADSLTRGPQGSSQHSGGPKPQWDERSSVTAQDGSRVSAAKIRQLLPGTLLRGGRYRLQEFQERQKWLAGVVENMWLAQDAQRGSSLVMMRELVLPDSGSMVMQSTLRTATMALSSVGRHPHIPTLWDAFGDRGRNFFVFEPVDGESLMTRMRRSGRAMPEQDVIECCLQMTEILELLAQQSPPLVHGLISPEHIVITRTGSRYVLTNFSIVLAGGATQFISGIDRTCLSVYTAPEFVRGVIDVRSDLFSLIATAYHAVTGSIPAGVSGSIPQAQRVNPHVSKQLDAILSKGLRPIASQRYQRPSELRQDLLAMRSVSGNLVANSSSQRIEAPLMTQAISSKEKQHVEPASQGVPDSLAQAFQSLASSDDREEQRLLLPHPEELPPMEERNDKLLSAFWLAGILIALLVVILLARGLF